jgi:polyphenol oxidase
MSRVFTYLGSSGLDYRSLMRKQQDLQIGGTKIPVSRIVVCEQTHSNLVHPCCATDCGAGFGDHPQIAVADGFVTDIEHQFLLIRTADCFPVLLYDQDARAVAAVHSGREGTRKNIARKAVQIMVKHYGCQADNILAYIGAGICEQHYEVSEELFRTFNASLEAESICPCNTNHRFLNLRTTIFQQLIGAGLPFKNIENIQICTYEHPDYFSYRRDHGNNRQINLIGIINE